MAETSIKAVSSTNPSAVETWTRLTSSPNSTTFKNPLDVNHLGSLLAGAQFDYIGVTYPTSSSEAYAFKYGGSGGTLVKTITVVYTDDTKENLSSVTAV